jgi:hypothetical protein
MKSMNSTTPIESTSPRSEALATRLERGARELGEFAATLTDAEWRMPVFAGGRKIGVIVHHVASVYPIEIQLAEALAAGNAITGVTWDVVADMNAGHAKDHDSVTKDAALELLRRNSATAASAIRALSDAQLARAASISLYADAPLTCQFMLEDHAVRHSYHHLAQIRRAVNR